MKENIILIQFKTNLIMLSKLFVRQNYQIKSYLWNLLI